MKGEKGIHKGVLKMAGMACQPSYLETLQFTIRSIHATLEYVITAALNMEMDGHIVAASQRDASLQHMLNGCRKSTQDQTVSAPSTALYQQECTLHRHI
jgi:hypothetical protein